MTILHYFLGFPPYRGGGLTRYAVDLMKCQLSLGHHVVAFWPGSFSILHRKCTLKRRAAYDGIANFEMINPLPVPLLYGVKNPSALMNEQGLNRKSFEEMLSTTSPQVIHIHTLMGLPLKYVQIAKEHGIKLVYTTHDYFGICPTVNKVDRSGSFSTTCSGAKCIVCNKGAKSTAFLRLRNMKSTVLLKKIKTLSF